MSKEIRLEMDLTVICKSDLDPIQTKVVIRDYLIHELPNKLYDYLKNKDIELKLVGSDGNTAIFQEMPRRK